MNMTGDSANKLPKEERLSGKTAVGALLSDGKRGSTLHLGYCWKPRTDGDASRMMVSVPKKNFKRAVKRNLLKRRIREGYRTQKNLLTGAYDILFVYKDKSVRASEEIHSEIRDILGQIGNSAK